MWFDEMNFVSDRAVSFPRKTQNLEVVNQFSRFSVTLFTPILFRFGKLRSKSSRETVISVKGCRLHRPQQFVGLLTVIYCSSNEIYCSSFSKSWKWKASNHNLWTAMKRIRSAANWVWSHQKTCAGHSFFVRNPLRSRSEKGKLLFTAAHLIFVFLFDTLITFTICCPT